RVSASGEARGAYCRCQAVGQNRINLMVWKFTGENTSESPRLNRVTRRKCVPPFKERNGLALDLRPWPLGDGLDDIHSDVCVDQGLDAESSRISCARVVAGFADQVERSPHRIKRIGRSKAGCPSTRSCEGGRLWQRIGNFLIRGNQRRRCATKENPPSGV